MLFVKTIVILLLVFVIISLFSGLYFLVKDKGQTNRTVNALSVRIGISMLAIVVILIAAATGVIEFNPSPLSGKSRQAPTTQNTNSELEQPATGGGRRRIIQDGS